MKQICTKQFNSNDVMSLHRDMTAVKTPNETGAKPELAVTRNRFGTLFIFKRKIDIDVGESQHGPAEIIARSNRATVFTG